MVRYAGVQVGTVKGLAVNEDGIEVTAEINDNVRIPQESTFSINSDGFWEKNLSIFSRRRVR